MMVVTNRAVIDRNRPVDETGGNDLGMTTYAEPFLDGPNELPAVSVVATPASVFSIRCVRYESLEGWVSR